MQITLCHSFIRYKNKMWLTQKHFGRYYRLQKQLILERKRLEVIFTAVFRMWALSKASSRNGTTRMCLWALDHVTCLWPETLTEWASERASEWATDRPNERLYFKDFILFQRQYKSIHCRGMSNFTPSSFGVCCGQRSWPTWTGQE